MPAQKPASSRAPKRPGHRSTESGQSRYPRRDTDSAAPRRHSGGQRPGRPEGQRGQGQRGQGQRRQERPARHEEVTLPLYEATLVTPESVAGTSFADLGLRRELIVALEGLGAEAPFPIQSATIPEALTGRDILARGKTGSGKTIAFGVAVVSRLAGKSSGRREFGRAPVSLIVAPTRELALQIDRTVQPLARAAGLFTTQIVGGVPQGRQVGALRRGVDIVIGTPGRLEDLIEQGVLDLSQVRITVVDEADHMAELGFIEPLQRLLRLTQGGGQKLFFSATLDRQVATLVEEFLVAPAVFEVKDPATDSAAIDHHVLVINHKDKRDLVRRLADAPGKTLVFTKTRAFAEELSDFLDDEGVSSVSLHGDLNQSRRQRNLQKLTDGRVRVLVATDVAARGIHVNDIDLVIHADQPDEAKTYIHRSGRTGRAGKTGVVVTLTTPSRSDQMGRLLDRAGVSATVTRVHSSDGPVPDLRLKPAVASH